MVKKEENLKESLENVENIPKADTKIQENKQLKKALLIFGGILIIFVAGYIVIDSIRHFNYEGVNYNVIKEGQIIFYTTKFPIYSSITGKQIADYNVYIRNDPRKLRDIPFNGTVLIQKDIVLNTTGDFSCQGDGIIAIANFAKLYQAVGANVIKDPKAQCDSSGKYTFIQISEGNETRIDQNGPSCYTFYVHNCEILKVTERFMGESLSKIKT